MLTTNRLSSLMARLGIEEPLLILESFEVKQGRVDRKKFGDWCGMSVLDQKKKEQNKDGVVVVPVIVSKSSVTHSMESASLARSQSRLNKRETGTSLMDLGNTSSDDDDLTVKAKVQKKKKLAKSLDFFAILHQQQRCINGTGTS